MNSIFIKMKYLLLPLFLIASLSSFAQKHDPVPSLENLLNSIEKIMEEKQVMGLTLGIVSHDSILFSGGLGYADFDEKRKADNKSLFRMGSITKSFVALGIIKLIEEGQIKLTDELKKIAPEVPFTNQWEAKNPIQIVHLLEQTTGFDDVKLHSMYNLSGKENKGIESVLVQKNSLITRWKPGERHSYCNPNYAILGYIIEKITGQDYDKYLTQTILEPLGMVHSNFNINSQNPALDTREYLLKNETLSVTLMSAAVGSLWSSTDDMIPFLKLFLNKGDTLFKASSIERIERHEENLAARVGLEFGYGLANQPSFIYRKNKFRGHDGWLGNCRASLFYSRELNAGFIISNNSNVQNNPISNLIIDFLEQQNPTNPIREKTIPLDKKAIEPFLGYYDFRNSRNQIGAFKDQITNLTQLYMKDGKLYQKQLLQPAFELIQVKPNIFTSEEANQPSFALTKNVDGKKVFISYTNYFEKTSATKAISYRVILVLAVLFAVSSIFYFIISFLGALVGRVNWKDLIWRFLPVLGLGMLIWAVLLLLKAQAATYLLYQLSAVSFQSLIIFIGTLSFGILTLLSTFFTIKRFKIIKNRYHGIYFLLIHLSMLLIMIILWQNGWIGLRTWAM